MREKPIITLGGTDPEQLSEQYRSAARAVEAALEAVKAAVPNARDYPPDSYRAVREAYEQDCETLRRLRYELRELWGYVEDQRNGR